MRLFIYSDQQQRLRELMDQFHTAIDQGTQLPPSIQTELETHFEKSRTSPYLLTGITTIGRAAIVPPNANSARESIVQFPISGVANDEMRSKFLPRFRTIGL